MANIYTQLNIHCVFSVKGRINLLTDDFRDDLFKYIQGILKNNHIFPLAVDGWRDHVHIFFELNPEVSVSKIMQVVKSNSSKWINENRFVAGRFEWQAGYSAFTYARSQRDTVIKYILNQKEHHRTTTFREEYLKILEKFEIEYNPKYIFEFYD